MAINRNLTLETIGVGRAADGGDDGGGVVKPPRGKTGGGAVGGITPPITGAGPVFTAPAATGPPPPGPAAPVRDPNTPPPSIPPPATVFTAPAVTAFPVLPIRDVGILNPPPITPPILPLPPFVFRPPVNKTTTQIAQGAMNQLRGAAADTIREAVNNIKNKSIAAGELVNFLERRTRVGEVLNELANDWSAQTKQDFADAFQMPNTPDKLPVMDAMVSIAILNDPDLRNELQAENTTDVSQSDLLENRRIVWQWPQPGTPFTPPYLIMVAVERQDTTQAQNVIQSIIGDLVDFQGFKIPTAAAQRLR